MVLYTKIICVITSISVVLTYINFIKYTLSDISIARNRKILKTCKYQKKNLDILDCDTLNYG